MRNVTATENIRRVPVRGIGTIMASEQAVTEWEGTLTCEFMEVRFDKTGIKNAIRRAFPSIGSQVLNDGTSFEDQLILDTEGVQLDIFKKVSDVIDAQGVIKPKLQPYASVKNCLIESDSFNISEAAIAGHNQSFKYLTPITYIQ
ncbi:hypothetical protein SAMN05444266_102220 [Chitinophaga jiangningensis]|uniref:Uncharacterized protein n=1 Tax=Chitinophaga jiangningensis TaxID=1419482 RepID=A0A1M6Y9U7_9BACT|nr:hypothetical protein [Chitinophaga jiangningensis]SHL15057.1 hypothetical protein SAMN05444266_102220 [Chitinophaga jiangningensis]